MIAVVGPAVVHTGAAEHLARLVELGYISVLFGGNAVATHDIESALYGTSLGVGLEDGVPWLGGHEHHLRAINTIRGCGSIAAAVEQGVLTKGLMYTLVKAGVPFVLAGSIRDDGPLPDVITDVHRGAERDARLRAERRRLPDALDDAALDRDRQHAAGVDHHGLCRHQPGGRHQARGPRLAGRRSASSPTWGCSSSTSPTSWRGRPGTARAWRSRLARELHPSRVATSQASHEGVAPCMRFFSTEKAPRETPSAPPLDALVPEHVETATFAVG